MAIMMATTAPYTTAIGVMIISFTIPVARVGPLFQTEVITSSVAPLRASTPSINPIWDHTQVILTNLVIADASNARHRRRSAPRGLLGIVSEDGAPDFMRLERSKSGSAHWAHQVAGSPSRAENQLNLPLLRRGPFS